MQSTDCDPTTIIERIKACIDKHHLITSHVEDKIGNIYSQALQYIDTDRDRKVVKALLAEITSSKFLAKLQGIQSTQSIQMQSNLYPHNFHTLRR